MKIDIYDLLADCNPNLKLPFNGEGLKFVRQYLALSYGITPTIYVDVDLNGFIFTERIYLEYHKPVLKLNGIDLCAIYSRDNKFIGLFLSYAEAKYYVYTKTTLEGVDYRFI